MKVTTTASRLNQIIDERGLRQVDILNAAKPYCLKYGVKLNKNDLSQYVSGKVDPGQEKLTILGLALNVSEVWLMGYDVPQDRELSTPGSTVFVAHRPEDYTDLERELIRKFRRLDDRGQAAVLNVLNYEYDSLPGEKAHAAPKEA